LKGKGEGQDGWEAWLLGRAPWLVGLALARLRWKVNHPSLG
jgi:hypothetical protein